MIKDRKFWSKRADDTLLLSLAAIATLGLYLTAAYIIITIL